jgi:hypothetical protein
MAVQQVDKSPEGSYHGSRRTSFLIDDILFRPKAAVTFPTNLVSLTSKTYPSYFLVFTSLFPTVTNCIQA